VGALQILDVTSTGNRAIKPSAYFYGSPFIGYDTEIDGAKWHAVVEFSDETRWPMHPSSILTHIWKETPTAAAFAPWGHLSPKTGSKS
jgi:hypothetical protein